MELYSNPLNKFVAGFIGSPAMNFINGKIVQSDKLYFVIDSLNIKLALETMSSRKLQQYRDKEITIGIRPEDILLSSEKSIAGDISIQVEVVEPMGNETLLYFTLQETQMIARGNPNQQYKSGNNYPMQINKDKIYFFDKESGTTL